LLERCGRARCGLQRRGRVAARYRDFRQRRRGARHEQRVCARAVDELERFARELEVAELRVRDAAQQRPHRALDAPDHAERMQGVASGERLGSLRERDSGVIDRRHDVLRYDVMAHAPGRAGTASAPQRSRFAP
jgi:hypothetical protein